MASSSWGLLDYLADIPDPRIERCRAHRLIDILMIAVCGALCGADNFVAIAEFGRAKAAWLKTFLALPNGIPSHDPFRRVFARIAPWYFQDCFAAWVQSLTPRLADQGEIVPLDGKTLRRSYDTGSGQAALHMVHAWAVNNRLVLGQFHCEEALEEIAIIPELLRLLDLKGCLVTTDALGCHKSTAEQVVAQQADYVLAVKANQPNSMPISNSFLTAPTRNWTPIPPSIIGLRKTKTTGGAKRAVIGPPTRWRILPIMPGGRAYACLVWSKPPGIKARTFQSNDATISLHWTTMPNDSGRPCGAIGRLRMPYTGS